ncbi:MAG TPA: hypothetical protein PLU50_11110, partial [Pseudobdellovibrionaceae bacterium]|nr:hypothetical protein [Pseudobdellovibrionaceae bacterium]
MSGIYTDKQYSVDAQNKTKSEAFLKKPFAPEILLKTVEGFAKSDLPQVEEAPTIVRMRKALYQLFLGAQPKKQKRRVIDSIEEIEGYDLPFLYSILMSTGESGTLNIYLESGELASVTLSKGNIVSVDVKDEGTVLGKLLIQSGYVIPQDVQWVLETKPNLKIGRALIENNRLSPHAFHQVLKEQMSLRISRTISKNKVRINFIPTEVNESLPFIDEDDLFVFLHDWIGSKIPGQWLSSVYLPWNFYTLRFVEDLDFSHPMFDLPLLKNPLLAPLFETKFARVGDLVNVDEKEQGLILKAVHLLLCKGILTLESGGKARNEAELQKILTKILGDIQSKTNLQKAEYFDHAGIVFRQGNVSDNLENYLGFVPSSQKSKSHQLYE